MRQLIRHVMLWILMICVWPNTQASGSGHRDIRGYTEAGGTSLDGARIAILGDSMTWIGGDSCQNHNGWTHYLREMVRPERIDIYARSGATWTNTRATQGDTSYYSEILADENVLYPQALRLIGAARADASRIPDTIILYAGANDAWFAERRPGIFERSAVNPALDAKPSECTSLESSIRLVCGILKREFPNARIVLMTPTEMTKASVERIRQVGDIIADTGYELGFAVLRPDIDVDIRSGQESITLTNTVDGVHTNPRGAKLLARYVVSKFQ